MLGRGLLYLQPSVAERRPMSYALDVRQFGAGGEGAAHLYLNGHQHAQSKLPAVFTVEGGVIEVATSRFGIKRCHYVNNRGQEHRLVPDYRSGEGRRARLEHEHPAASRLIGAVSVLLLLVGVGLNVLQLLEPLSRIPVVAARVGAFTSPVSLPIWLNIALGLGAVLASIERGLRLRYHWLLDGGGH